MCFTRPEGHYSGYRCRRQRLGRRTLEICRKWGVPTFYVPPGNMYRAINQGLRQMDMEWITDMNSDDLVYAQSYARMLALGNRKKRTPSTEISISLTTREDSAFWKGPAASAACRMFRRDHMGSSPQPQFFAGVRFRNLGDLSGIVLLPITISFTA